MKTCEKCICSAVCRHIDLLWDTLNDYFDRDSQDNNFIDVIDAKDIIDLKIKYTQFIAEICRFFKEKN